MKKNKSVLLSTPYLIWMVVFTLIPLGVVAYYALTDPATVEIDMERANYWIGNGAQPTDTVRALLKKAQA